VLSRMLDRRVHAKLRVLVLAVAQDLQVLEMSVLAAYLIGLGRRREFRTGQEAARPGRCDAPGPERPEGAWAR